MAIKDRRPTGEEIECAMVDGVSTWLLSWISGIQRHCRVERYSATGMGDLSKTWYRGSIPKHTLDPSNMGMPFPGEIWRALNPDGSEMVIEPVRVRIYHACPEGRGHYTYARWSDEPSPPANTTCYCGRLLEVHVQPQPKEAT